jgi:hypothetical protein
MSDEIYRAFALDAADQIKDLCERLKKQGRRNAGSGYAQPYTTDGFMAYEHLRDAELRLRSEGGGTP